MDLANDGYATADAPCEATAQEGLVDKLRGGDYGDLIASAQKGHHAQQAAAEMMAAKANGPATDLCVTERGVVQADPHTAFYKGPAPQSNYDDDKISYEDDLKKMRAARIKEMQDEKRWKKLGHGELRELEDEKEFLFAIRPHERAVVLLDDGRPAGADVQQALVRLAKRHVETQFCRLPAGKAFFLTQMVELEGLPAVFIVEEGKVKKQLTPEILFEFSSASSPLFVKHLARALHRVGGITDAEAPSSAEEDEEEDSYARRKPLQGQAALFAAR